MPLHHGSSHTARHVALASSVELCPWNPVATLNSSRNPHHDVLTAFAGPQAAFTKGSEAMDFLQNMFREVAYLAPCVALESGPLWLHADGVRARVNGVLAVLTPVGP